MSSRPRSIEMTPLAAPPDATITVPGSKSLTNRALVCAALAEGRSEISGALEADDTEAMIGALQALGVDVVNGADGSLSVGRVGSLTGAADEAAPVKVDARLSGTTARFVLPVACLARGVTIVDGEPPLRRRPIGPLLGALRSLGGHFDDLGDADHLPQRVHGSGLRGGEVAIRGDVSSQFVTALLLAGPCTDAGLRLTVTSDLVARPFVDLTIDVMREFGAEVETPSAFEFRVKPSGYTACDYAVEPDATAASYFLAAAAMTGGRVRVPGLGRHTRQGDIRFVDVLAAMGADVILGDDLVEVRGSGRLRGVDVDLSATPDVAQTVAVVAACADGPTRIRGVEVIRGHETDRITAVVNELRRCGVEAHEEVDGFTIIPGALRPAEIHTYDDHRMAMSFALLGLVTPGITILDPSCTSKTFPTFFDVLAQLSVGSRR